MSLQEDAKRLLPCLVQVGRAMHDARTANGITLRKMAAILKCDVMRLSILETSSMEPPDVLDFVPALLKPAQIENAMKGARKCVEERERIIGEIVEELMK